MKSVLSPSLVKQSLKGHSWIGLLVGALMYLICLSGTLLVFYEELERWEQPFIEEPLDYDPLVLESAFNQLMNSGEEITPHMYIDLPGTALPRASVSTENKGWYVKESGELGDEIHHNWTEMLTELHLYLHLPSAWGMIFVSALGAMLCGLIVSGFLSHPSIFSDAFSWRTLSSRRMEQVDIHNRLSVWAAPFHLIIAITGAYFGLAILVLGLITKTSGYSEPEILEMVYGSEPQLEEEVGHIAIARSLAQMSELAPNAEPLFITLHDAGTPAQFIEIYAQFPERLIYSENYRFDPAGEFLGTAGFLDGETGKQAVYSVYRLHFGHFGGFWMKIIYFLSGLALTVVSVTGINIWLEKRKQKDFINYLWSGFVWGTPFALITSAMVLVFWPVQTAAIFWCTLLCASLFGLFCKDEANTKNHLQFISLIGVFSFLLLSLIKFGWATFSMAAIGPNSVLICYALFLAYSIYQRRDQQS